jgi:hypothetical protein
MQKTESEGEKKEEAAEGQAEQGDKEGEDGEGSRLIGLLLRVLVARPRLRHSRRHCQQHATVVQQPQVPPPLPVVCPGCDRRPPSHHQAAGCPPLGPRSRAPSPRVMPLTRTPAPTRRGTGTQTRARRRRATTATPPRKARRRRRSPPMVGGRGRRPGGEGGGSSRLGGHGLGNLVHGVSAGAARQRFALLRRELPPLGAARRLRARTAPVPRPHPTNLIPLGPPPPRPQSTATLSWTPPTTPCPRPRSA